MSVSICAILAFGVAAASTGTAAPAEGENPGKEAPIGKPTRGDHCEAVKEGSLSGLAFTCGPHALKIGGALTTAVASQFSGATAAAIASNAKYFVPRAVGALSVIGIPLSLYSVGQLGATAMQIEAECNADMGYKRSLIERVNENAELILGAYRTADFSIPKKFQIENLSEIEARKLKLADSYLKPEILQNLSCTHLYDLVGQKTLLHDARMGRLVASGLAEQDPRKREASKEETEYLKKIAAGYECSTPAAKLEIACAVYSVAVMGKNLVRGVAPTKSCDPTPVRPAALTPIEATKITGYDMERVLRAEALLGRSLNETQRSALIAAHEYGPGLGKDGIHAAGKGNYTFQQLLRKHRILREAGYTQAEREALSRAGLVGKEYYGDFPPIQGSRLPRSREFAKANFEAIAQRYPRMLETEAKIAAKFPHEPPINHPRQIPFERADADRPKKAAEMLKRAEELPPEMEKSIVAVYNQLNDSTAGAAYFKKLFRDTAEHMARRGITSDLELLERGVINPNTIAAVLVKRAKLRGDTQFTTINKFRELKAGRLREKMGDLKYSEDEFRAAVRTGPFFDRAEFSLNREGHGDLTHLIQRDMVWETLKKTTKGQPGQFFEFMGTKKGINWWIDLFDSRNPSMTSPESMFLYLSHTMVGR